MTPTSAFVVARVESCAMCTHLVIAIHTILVCIDAPWPWIGRVVHKNPVHALALMQVVPNLCPMAGYPLCWTLQAESAFLLGVDALVAAKSN